MKATMRQFVEEKNIGIGGRRRVVIIGNNDAIW
jgi:hypothetical protein